MERPKLLIIAGPNGAGKTTVLLIMGILKQEDAGGRSTNYVLSG